MSFLHYSPCTSLGQAPRLRSTTRSALTRRRRLGERRSSPRRERVSGSRSPMASDAPTHPARRAPGPRQKPRPIRVGLPRNVLHELKSNPKAVGLDSFECRVHLRSARPTQVSLLKVLVGPFEAHEVGRGRFVAGLRSWWI